MVCIEAGILLKVLHRHSAIEEIRSIDGSRRFHFVAHAECTGWPGCEGQALDCCFGAAPLLTLSQVGEGARVSIKCLPMQPELQRRLLSMGIRPGVEIEVLRRGQPGGIMHLASGLLEFMLRQEQAAEMEVTLIPPV